MSASRQHRCGVLGPVWLTCACVLGMAGALAADTIYVDDDAALDPGPGNPAISDPDEDGSSAHPFDAIQEGIEAAFDGDEVVIRDGTYTGYGNRDLDFGGKAITVRSDSDDPATCVIDCQGSEEEPHRGFYFHSGETSDSVLKGVTITAGYVTEGSPAGAAGGGVYCSSSSPTLRNCEITENEATGGTDAPAWGGGLYCTNGSPALSACAITANTAYSLYNLADGGGIWCSHGNLTILDCTISENTASGGYTAYGGGVFTEYADPVISACTITYNTAHQSDSFGHPAGASGGGIHSEQGNPRIAYCIISNNGADADALPADGRGGGVTCSGGELVDCTIMENVAAGFYGYSGGVDSSGGDLVGCTIADNVADGLYSYSGGLGCASARVTECVIRGNRAQGDTTEMYGGGGVGAGWGTTFTDCEITENQCTLGANVFCCSNAIFVNCAITSNAGPFGEGVYSWNGAPKFSGCRLAGHRNGGCMQFVDSSPVIANCTFVANVSDSPGAAIHSRFSTPAITNCTFFGNQSYGGMGGSIRCISSEITIVNSIFWGSSPGEIYVQSGSAQVTYSCIQNGWLGVGNISLDPLFVDPLGPDGLVGTEDDDLRLRFGSPCIDTGTNSPPGGLPTEDLEGRPRVLDGDGDDEAVVDMGTYEYRLPTPDQLNVVGPIPNQVPIGTYASLKAQVLGGFIPMFNREVVFTKLSGSFLFIGGEVLPDGTQSTVETDPTGTAEVFILGYSAGPGLIQVSVTDSALPATYYVFEIVPSTPGLTQPVMGRPTEAPIELAPMQARPRP